MKTREQLRNEDGVRCADKYSDWIKNSGIPEIDQTAVNKGLMGVLLLALKIRDDHDVQAVFGSVIAEFGRDLSTLRQRLDAAEAAQKI